MFFCLRNRGVLKPLFLSVLAACFVMTLSARKPAAQDLRFAQTEHFQVGGGLAFYPLGGSYSPVGDQLTLQGIQIECLHLGISQLVSPAFRMELAFNMGVSLLTQEFKADDPISGDTGISDLGAPFNWGFVIGGYHRFQRGITLGLGLGIDFMNTKIEPVDTSLFRAMSTLGWERVGPLHDWYLHVRWVNGVTLLHGLEEFNWRPETSFSMTGFEIVYGM